MGQTQEKNFMCLNGEITNSIEVFLTKKRRRIVEILAEKVRLSHGELAEAADTSGASLSNILLRFEQFEYKLLDSESEGKRRYYFLSDLGNEYAEKYIKNAEYVENVVSRETFQTMKNVKNCLESVKNLYDYKWETVLDDAMLSCIECTEKQFENGDEEINAFLISVEKTLLYDYENCVVKLMKMLSSNNILVNRFEQFLEVFELYRPLLEAWDAGVEILCIYDFLESAVTGNVDTIKMCAQKLDWKEREYTELVKQIGYIVKHTEGKDRSEIHKYFCRILLGNQSLSAFLTKVIHDFHKRR